jgi:hypothetical protein
MNPKKPSVTISRKRAAQHRIMNESAQEKCGWYAEKGVNRRDTGIESITKSRVRVYKRLTVVLKKM